MVRSVFLLLLAMLVGCGSLSRGGDDCLSFDEVQRQLRAADQRNQALLDQALADSGLTPVELPRPQWIEGDPIPADWTVRPAPETGGHELAARTPNPMRLARDRDGRYVAVEWIGAPVTERVLVQCGCDPGRGIEARPDPGPIWRVPLDSPRQFRGEVAIRSPQLRLEHRWQRADGPPSAGCHMAP